MDAGRTPFSPGAGRAPAVLVGRDRLSAGWRVALERVEAGSPSRPVALHGLRGIGTTALLTEFASGAQARGWVVVRVDARVGTSLRAALGDALRVTLAGAPAGDRLLRALATWESEDAGPGIGFETDLARLIGDLSAAANSDGVGLALLIDDAQDLTNLELTAVCTTARLAGRQGWSALFAVAGLPSLPRALADATVWPEPVFELGRLDQLDDERAGDVLTATAATAGATWDDEAVALVVREARGYPCFLQQLGQDTWNVAPGPHITVADARAGAARGRATLDSGMRERWDRATLNEQRLMRAMAVDGDAASSGPDLSRRLGRPYVRLAVPRAKLIAKGLICSPAFAVVAFTDAGMAAFVARQRTPALRVRARAAGGAPGRRPG